MRLCEDIDFKLDFLVDWFCKFVKLVLLCLFLVGVVRKLGVEVDVRIFGDVIKFLLDNF